MATIVMNVKCGSHFRYSALKSLFPDMAHMAVSPRLVVFIVTYVTMTFKQAFTSTGNILKPRAGRNFKGELRKSDCLFCSSQQCLVYTVGYIVCSQEEWIVAFNLKVQEIMKQ